MMMLKQKSSQWAAAKVLFILPLVCVALGAFAQTKTVTVADQQKGIIKGVVLDENDKTIGTILKINGTENSVVTDKKGAFSMAANNEAKLEVLSINGESSQTIKIVAVTNDNDNGKVQDVKGNINKIFIDGKEVKKDEAKEEFLITFEPDKQQNNTVKTKGQIYKVHLVTDDSKDSITPDPIVFVDGKRVKSMDDIKSEDIESVDVLKGEKAVLNYGKDAKNGVVIIRTKSNSNKKIENPLYVVDGKKVKTIKDLNPDDIDNINVLKGKSATDQYGQEGKDGVLVITTKKQKK